MKNSLHPPAKGAAAENNSSSAASPDVPSITLPKGGGSIRSIDEKFSINSANGTAGLSMSFPFSSSRNGFMPDVGLSYSSGNGNSTFGLGWNADPPAIMRRTDKQLPSYNDTLESDVFLFSGAEDLVPAFNKDADGNWIKDQETQNGITVIRYRPRIDGTFARIEKITEADGNVFWKVTSAGNAVSVYGKSRSAQVFDPADPSRIFKWLFEFSYDDKGNCFQYVYKKEDNTNVPDTLYEKNRLNNNAPCTNAYLKRIRYCNSAHLDKASINYQDWDNFLANIAYLLELMLDYGEHDAANPQPQDDNGWPVRLDAFSEYRAGFEIRTRRLCRRLLMFHHFPELGAQPCLVRSLNLLYSESTAFTFLTAIIQKGYIRKENGAYSEKALPPVELTYEPLGWNTDIKTVPPESLRNWPVGIDEPSYQWIDLYGEGIAGILTEQGHGWFYKSNAGDGHFDNIQLVTPKPAATGLTTGKLHFQDIGANGQMSLVSDDMDGFYARTSDQEWLPFQSFTHVPNIDVKDPHVKLIDLDGDGRPDLLVSEENVFVWYVSKGKEGYTDWRKTGKAFDEEKGPNMVFADSTQSIVLVDMTGDGLTDIVRIRNSEIVYWPNLGYGEFGAKVSMDNAPVFDHPDHFNPAYLKLADLDGSGTTDIVYLAKNTCKVYFNQSGNSWSEENIVRGVNPLPFPGIDDHTKVTVVDLLGNGTGCIVWSSSLPAHAQRPLQYIDLMGGRKPHILTAYKNNMGKEVKIDYKSSTFYYLQDKKADTPWATRLPFPVQCVSSVVMIDQVRKSRFTNHYTYHHGYFDHAEREFRGFGRVEQTDTEDFEQFKKHTGPGGIQIVDEGFHEPPVLTKTWFHTGAFINREKILSQLAQEYYKSPLVQEHTLPEPVLPPDLTIEECRQALRACKGMPLRVEVFSPDGNSQQEHPFSTAHHNCSIQLIQPALDNRFAVFMVNEGEVLTYTWDREPGDPRIAHTMNIERDAFGNVLKAAAISYGRRTTDPDLTAEEQAMQAKINILFSESLFTNSIDTGNDYHLPVVYEVKTFELTGATPAAIDYFTVDEIRTAFEQAAVIPFQAIPTPGTPQKRMVEQVRTLFMKNDASGPLPAGVIESLVFPWESYKLALTPSLRDDAFGTKVTDDMLLNECRLVHQEDDNFWIPSGTRKMDASHFFQVTEMTDPFGNSTTIHYDTTYHFFIQQVTDALGNRSVVNGFNYRMLSAWLITNINDNRSGVRADELGMVTATFRMGKTGENTGDLIDESAVEASDADEPTQTFEYDLFNYMNNGKPNFIKQSIRETHFFESRQSGQPVKWQTAFTYTCGGGNEAMAKVQAEPGLALQENPDGTVIEVDTTPNLRWVGNGRTIFNNKGKPVKQFEPYFSTTFEFEDAKELVERGVTPIIHYDAAGRVFRTDLPDGTFTKTVFGSWKQLAWDANDTVLESQWYKDRITEPVPGIATPEEIAAANKAAAHANTPVVSHVDSLGRAFLSIADNGVAGQFKTFTVADIEGNPRRVIDALGNSVIRYKQDMAGTLLNSFIMDAGEQWFLNDCQGKPVRSWNSRNHAFRTEYDALQRPVKRFLSTDNAPGITTDQMVYGEGIANDKQLNMRGMVYQTFDAAGLSTSLANDFKGNPLQSTRQLLRDYKNMIDWSASPALETEIFTSSIAYDALSRPVLLQVPGNYTIRPVYNEGGYTNEVFASIKGGAEQPFVKDIDYDAKGQRRRILYGNDIQTGYTYHSKTMQLQRVTTKARDTVTNLQDIQLTYDPVGNISFIKDSALPDVVFDGQTVKAEKDFLYDAIYRLIAATGREHIGQNKLNETAGNNNFRNFPFENDINPNDTQALRNYTQQYVYDAVGSILQLKHIAGAGSYTRDYRYNNNEADRTALGIDPSTIKNNQLLATIIGGNTTRYQYDAHGNMMNLTHLQSLQWNPTNALQMIDLGGGGKAYYVYNSSGLRTRKVIERLNGMREERIYLSGFEIHRQTSSAGNIQHETETLHILDNSKRIALVETETIKDGAVIPPAALQPLVRYQLSDHLGSASLELDDTGRMISYEEYHPYGTTSLYHTNDAIQAAWKRYRYIGLERDEESGLDYHNARYYLPWLGRWLNADPAGTDGGLNLYAYAANNPVAFVDDSGNEPRPVTGITIADVKDRTDGGSNVEIVNNLDEGTFSRTKTLVGYGWVDVGDGRQKKVHYNLTETYINDRYSAGGPVTTQQAIFFEMEPEYRYRGKLDLSISEPKKPAAKVEVIPKAGETEKTTVQHKESVSTIPKYKPPSKKSLFNRIIGGLKVIGSYFEITAGAALCATVIGCIVGAPLVAHGVDVGISGVRSIISGEYTRTFTSKYLLEGALGLSEGTAEIVDTVISLAGGMVRLAQTGLSRLSNLASKQPWKYGQVPNNANGITSWGGEITIKNGLSGTQLVETVTHEGVHRLLAPIGTSRLAVARQGLKRWGAQHSDLLNFLEEGIAQSAATGSWVQGFRWVNQPVQRMGYGITTPRMIAEGTGYVLGTAGLSYGAYKLSKSYFSSGDN